MSDNAELPLWVRFIQVSQKFGRAGQMVIQPHGLTAANFLVLFYVLRTPSLTQQQLADAMQMTKGNISQMMVVMERAGLIERRTAKGSNQILLTDKAQQLYATVSIEHDKFVEGLFQQLEPGDVSEFARLLAAIDATIS